MTKWLSILCLLAALPVAGSGCAYPCMGTRALGSGGVCGPAYRAEPCGPMEVASCAAACGSAECDPCDPCGPCHYGHYSPFGPLVAIFRIFRPVTWMGPSCGERYWGDFYSDPPDCCDPCDYYGNYTGAAVCDCRPRGVGRVAAGCVDDGCGVSCADGGCYSAVPAHTGLPGYATTPRPTSTLQQEPAYLGQSQPRMPRPVMLGQPQRAYLGQQPSHLRSPAGATLPNSRLSSRFAPRVISVDDRIVGEPGPQPTTAARRIEAVQR